MVSAYQPDPRLPPDQQLLPTVARRLQQEKWEREGKFGNVYDRDFRPLNDEEFARPPEKNDPMQQDEPGDEEWPLKSMPRSPGPPPNSYTTMPKITDLPTASPLPSPRHPIAQAPPFPVVRPPPEPQDAAKEKGGCGCCLVM
jgi:hypothetical protein